MMHTYATNSRERREIPFFIAAGAIAASLGISVLFEKYHFAPPLWLSIPVDTMALYGLLYLLFDRVIWKWRLTHFLKITRVPDLSGEWHGHVKPTETGGTSAGLATETSVVLTIKQTWTEMRVTVQAKHSRSYSLSASIIVDEPCGLSYEYRNDPSADALGTMHSHRGTAWLEYDGKHGRLAGEYYSGRDRQTIGTIVVGRVGKSDGQ